jgi:hypothetical protein
LDRSSGREQFIHPIRRLTLQVGTVVT